MTRLPALRQEELAADRRAVYDEICLARGAETLDDRGGQIGPFNAFVHAPPEIGRHLLELGNALNFRSGLSFRLTELAMITVGAHWQSEFEWWAHARRAQEAGLPAGIIDAIGEGREPDLDDPADAAVYRVASQLIRDGRVDDEAYEAAVHVLDYSALVGLVAICGYYTLICFTLNAFQVQLPNGVLPQWGG